MKIPHNITDCGRDPTEKLDCSVRALAHCLNIPYSQAHAMLSFERKNRCGIKHKKFVRNLDKFGLEQRPDLSCMTLAKALPNMSHGRFLCNVTHHYFAVVDGVVFDTWEQKPGRRLLMVYQPKI